MWKSFAQFLECGFNDMGWPSHKVMIKELFKPV